MQLTRAWIAATALLLVAGGATAQPALTPPSTPPPSTPPPSTPPPSPPPSTPPTAPAVAPPGTVDDDSNAALLEEAWGDPDYLPGSDPAPAADDGPPPTGTLRGGLYLDDDQTRVYRVFAAASVPRGAFALTGSLGIDAVTSASLDVRSSPLGAVDVVTGASGRTTTSGGTMSDTRAQLGLGGTWDDSHGHIVSLTAVGAAERDYKSAGGDLNGSVDILGRTVTLLGGVSYTSNWISSVLDHALAERMTALGWSIGVARVMTPNDALRLRYDGADDEGYQASPYRNVRFGDWTTTHTAHQIIFHDTLGSADGLPELEPRSRVRHALVLEWLHALGDDAGLHPSVRVSHDDWGVNSLTAGLELRVAKPTWRMQLGYRYYAQSRADFFQDKYTADPSTYTYYTADKDLGDVSGHLGSVELSKVLREPDPSSDGQNRLLLDVHLDVFRYAYAGFLLLPARTSAFVQVGLTWEL